MKVMQFPLAKMTGWFVCGILFSRFAEIQLTKLFPFWIAALAVWLAAYQKARIRPQKRIFFGLGLALFAFLTGAALLQLHAPDSMPGCFTQLVDAGKTYRWQAIVNEQLKKTATHDRYVVRVVACDEKPAQGKLLLQLPRSAAQEPLQEGMLLQFPAAVYLPRTAKNPGQFDYGSYLKNHGILAQAYADRTQLQIARKPVKDFRHYAGWVRHAILKNLKKSGLRDQQLSVVSALVLGQKQELSAETLQNYQFAGAVHILSVSGLHVGLIIIFVNFLLRFVPKTKKYRSMSLLVTLLALWGFALLAGFAPSVLRAVTMFSFVAVGMHLRRPTNAFHTLMVSMLILLIAEPLLLFDVGFQLSYAAVLFILWLQPIFRRLWRPENKLVYYFWQIITVSVAAQLGTLPISLYYFHQFPGLFFLTNLIVIPMLTVIMALAIANCVWAAFAIVPHVLLLPLDACVRLLNHIIARIASVETLVFRDLPFDGVMLIASYLFVIALFIWVTSPGFKNATALLFSVAVLQFVLVFTPYQHARRNEWTVFHLYKNSLITAKYNSRITAFTNVEGDTDRQLRPYAVNSFASVTTANAIPDLFYFKGQKILIVDQAVAYPTTVAPNIVLLRNSPKINLERFLDVAHPRVIVADGSNYTSYVKLWKQTCERHAIHFHDTRESGCFQL